MATSLRNKGHKDNGQNKYYKAIFFFFFFFFLYIEKELI